MRVYTISQKDTRILLYEWMQERVGILDYLIYDSSSVGPVMEKFSDNPQKKGFLSELETRPSSGYVIRTFSNAKLSSFLENDYMNDSLDSDKILFSAKGRYGPNIFVYSLEKL